MRNIPLFIGALLGLISVIMGAAGDHFMTLDTEQLHSLETAIRYNMLYAVLIVSLSLHTQYKWPLRLFIGGCIIFCFSIYAALICATPNLTYLTPIGGLTLMMGWGFLAGSAIKKVKLEQGSVLSRE